MPSGVASGKVTSLIQFIYCHKQLNGTATGIDDRCVSTGMFSVHFRQIEKVALPVCA
jgi:hypothetical protein